jgi:hypothetical protein
MSQGHDSIAAHHLGLASAGIYHVDDVEDWTHAEASMFVFESMLVTKDKMLGDS